MRGFHVCAEEDSNLHPVIPDQALNLVTRVSYPSLCVHIVQNVQNVRKSGHIGRSGCCHGCCHGPEVLRATTEGADSSLRQFSLTGETTARSRDRRRYRVALEAAATWAGGTANRGDPHPRHLRKAQRRFARRGRPHRRASGLARRPVSDQRRPAKSASGQRNLSQGISRTMMRFVAPGVPVCRPAVRITRAPVDNSAPSRAAIRAPSIMSSTDSATGMGVG